MRLLQFLAPLLFRDTRRLLPGTRVNEFRAGAMRRTDGVVVAHLDEGVLVEWPRGGQDTLPLGALTVIC